MTKKMTKKEAFEVKVHGEIYRLEKKKTEYL